MIVDTARVQDLIDDLGKRLMSLILRDDEVNTLRGRANELID